MLRTTVEIVRKPADQQGFVVHRRRWVVERRQARWRRVFSMW
ncbi:MULTISPECIES: hypothetical protein [unclassified Micromonospora]|nr:MULTISPECIES: hypothetical protein [unclassified Micromonospora]